MSSPSSSPPPAPPPPENVFSFSDLDSSTAETQLLENIESRRGRVRTASGEAYQVAVAGERPALGDFIRFEQLYNLYDDNQRVSSSFDSSNASIPAAHPSLRFRDVVQRVMQKRQEEKKASAARRKGKHKRSATPSVHALLQIITEEDSPPTAASGGSSNNNNALGEQGETEAPEQQEPSAEFFNAGVGHQEKELGKSAFAVEASQMDHLVHNALKVEKLLQKRQDEDDASASTTSSTEDQLPLLGDEVSYGATQMERLRERRLSRQNRRRYLKVLHKILRCLNPYRWLCLFWQMLTSAYFLLMALPLFVIAWICYYYLGNPRFDFMPGKATLSWWFNFIGRQLLTLELARLTQFIFIDGVVLGSKYTLQWLGPLVTLWALQSKGWPLIAISWGMWDMLLLHGNNAFQTHWLYATGIQIYSKANSGSYILSSDLYLRALLSIMLAGLAISVKRASVAIHFGRRTFVVFKPRLEKILQDIVILSDVADLAEEADRMSASAAELDESGKKSTPAPKRVAGSVKWLSDDGIFQAEGHQEDPASDADSWSSPNSAEHKSMLKRGGSGGLARSDSGSIRIKNFLDRWQEPVNKLEKTSDTTIHDILRFRRALAFMDDPRPFGETFGPASTRDECIESAHSVYERLLKLTPGSSVLSNDVIIMLAQEDGETINSKKRSALKRLIRPDRFNNIPLLAFVQTCDSLYRRLRYFRASVGNASVIDRALEKIFDGVFGFFLFLMILSLMNINPWPLLVSLSTLLVSFSFAMGASASKYIEGVLLIAVRRPYDLGDRIVFDNINVPHPGAGTSWFVEDINLFSTTLRYALTSEVATVNNGSIAGERISNLNRSPNAVCNLEQPMHMRFLEKDCDQVFKTAIERYVVDHPRVWEELVNFRFNKFDSDSEKLFLRLDIRHRNSWQDATRVLRDFGEFQRFVHSLGEAMSVNFDSAPARRILYHGGILKSGQVEDYKISLYSNQNINSYAEEGISEPKVPSVDKTVADSLFLAQLQQSNEPK